jgi:hypothetical protein
VTAGGFDFDPLRPACGLAERFTERLTVVIFTQRELSSHQLRT